MKKLLLTVSALSLFAAPAMAQQASNTPYISLGAGYYDILDDDGAADFRLEYRPGQSILIDNLQPWLGAEVTSDASVWVGVGLLYDWQVTDNFYVAPSFGVGFYDEGNSDKDLDYPLEFRSQLEAGYEFANEHRVGLAFGHISNASLGDDNPGTEILNAYWHIPY